MYRPKKPLTVCVQVIVLQQQGQAIQHVATPSQARREAKYQTMISGLLSLDCLSVEAVHQYLNGSNVEE